MAKIGSIEAPFPGWHTLVNGSWQMAPDFDFSPPQDARFFVNAARKCVLEKVG
jgi:hypothetical protein